MNKNNFGTPFYATGTGSTVAVATYTGVTSQTAYITDISGSSDLATSTILVKDGSTTIWQDIVGAGSYRMNFLTPLPATSGATVTITVTGSAACKGNMSGFYNNN